MATITEPFISPMQSSEYTPAFGPKVQIAPERATFMKMKSRIRKKRVVVDKVIIFNLFLFIDLIEFGFSFIKPAN